MCRVTRLCTNLPAWWNATPHGTIFASSASRPAGVLFSCSNTSRSDSWFSVNVVSSDAFTNPSAVNHCWLLIHRIITKIWTMYGAETDAMRSTTCFVVIWKYFCFILSTGTKIRMDSVMRPRSSQYKCLSYSHSTNPATHQLLTAYYCKLNVILLPVQHLLNTIPDCWFQWRGNTRCLTAYRTATMEQWRTMKLATTCWMQYSQHPFNHKLPVRF